MFRICSRCLAIMVLVRYCRTIFDVKLLKSSESDWEGNRIFLFTIHPRNRAQKTLWIISLITVAEMGVKDSWKDSRTIPETRLADKIEWLDAITWIHEFRESRNFRSGNVREICSVSFSTGISGWYLTVAKFRPKTPDYLVTSGSVLRLIQVPLFPELSRKVTSMADKVPAWKGMMPRVFVVLETMQLLQSPVRRSWGTFRRSGRPRRRWNEKKHKRQKGKKLTAENVGTVDGSAGRDMREIFD